MRASFLATIGDISEEEARDYAILITRDECDLIVREVARKLNDYYASRLDDKPVHLLGLLTGAFYFIALLLPHLRFPYHVHFVKVSSYSGQVQQNVKLDVTDIPALGKTEHVVIIDELIDSGNTVYAIKAHVPHAVVCAAFARQASDREGATSRDFTPEFCGYSELPNPAWLIGFGLDDLGIRRGWPHIFVKGGDQEAIFEFRGRFTRALDELRASLPVPNW
ncbi:Guanine phosphoribosyltransferase [Giardia muris]|uniref:Guanine phosphoribosyltransferase n=1 Tax=Giardia muris TaxID=5742 RepID=A0A4Z1T843_GIAMU|nr:Guanine phosphoribosyltransferase [Giardia muris]|eukprot:TNJ28661.1 Guanine phosphoribosyltransferase [Giardia muris]